MAEHEVEIHASIEVIASSILLLFTTNHPRLCRTLLAERHYVLTWFSGRTTDTSAVDVSILVRPAMSDSSAERTGCANPLTSMFFAALTLLLRSLPQSGHLNRILFLSCADASNLATPHLLHVSEVYAGSTRTTDIPAPSALYVRICANSPHVCSSIVRLAADLIVTP